MNSKIPAVASFALLFATTTSTINAATLRGRGGDGDDDFSTTTQQRQHRRGLMTPIPSVKFNLVNTTHCTLTVAGNECVRDGTYSFVHNDEYNYTEHLCSGDWVTSDCGNLDATTASMNLDFDCSSFPSMPDTTVEVGRLDVRSPLEPERPAQPSPYVAGYCFQTVLV